jgi:hypothetical protein
MECIAPCSSVLFFYEVIMVTIVAAAIQDWNDGNVYSVPQPGRHHDVIQLMTRSGCKTPIAGDQGFLTSEGKFVSRSEAKEIAEAANQLLPRADCRGGHLFSEDVW